MKAVVTVKLPRNPKHDPRNKQSGMCPLSKRLSYVVWCTDITGSHHSYTETGVSRKDIEREAKRKFGHVTRIEFVRD